MRTEGLHLRLIDLALPVGCKPAPLAALKLMYFTHGGVEKKMKRKSFYHFSFICCEEVT